MERIHPGIVDCRRVVEIARELADHIKKAALKVERGKLS